MKTIFLLILALTHFTPAQAQTANDCSVKVGGDNFTSKRLIAFSKKMLVRKGYTIVENGQPSSFVLSVNATQICTDGKETFWDDLLRAYDVADIYLFDSHYNAIYKKEAHLDGFVFKVLLQKSLKARRMLKHLPECKDGVIQLPETQGE
jgi:hypothetical protein